MKVVMTDRLNIVTARADAVYFNETGEDCAEAVLIYGNMEFTVPIAQITCLEDEDEEEE